MRSLNSVIFVHGTGVRLPAFQTTLGHAKETARAAGLNACFIECAWGDPLGANFEGRCLPGFPTPQRRMEDAEDLARWSRFLDDPFFELHTLTIRDTQSHSGASNSQISWRALWNQISQYAPSHECRLLLERGALTQFWEESWNAVILCEVAPLAFERSEHELHEVCGALARAAIAELHSTATQHGHPGISRPLRIALERRLLSDWGQVVYSPSDFLASLVSRAATKAVRHHRDDLMRVTALAVGDVLLYQAHGCRIRDFIRQKISSAEPPVAIIAHSLGSIAAFDLLATPSPPRADLLVTVGSPVSFFYEIGASASLGLNQKLPEDFPSWLNVYDRSDFLSYVASALFGKVKDVEISSGQPFPHSHSAYFTNPEFWKEIIGFYQP